MEQILITGAKTFGILGVLVGFLIPLVGNIGIFMVIPLLMLVGLTPEQAIPIGLAHMALLHTPTVAGQIRSGHTDIRLLTLLLTGTIPGYLLADRLNEILITISYFNHTIFIIYLLLLAGAFLYRKHPFPILPKPNNLYRKKIITFIKKVPGHIFLVTSCISVSFIIPFFLGITFGLVSKTLGPLSALIICPILVFFLDIPVMVAMNTVTLFIFLSFITIAMASSLTLIPLNLIILLWIFLGSSLTLLAVSTLPRRSKLSYQIPFSILFIVVTLGFIQGIF